MTNDAFPPPRQSPTGPDSVPESASLNSLFEPQPQPSPVFEAVTMKPDPVGRVWPSLLWDVVLLIGGVIGFWLMLSYGSFGETFSSLGLGLSGVIPVLLLAMALSVSMRAGTVNLAVVHLASLAGLLYLYLLEYGEVVALPLALGAALVGGLVIAAAVVLLRAPAWAASIVVVLAVLVVISSVPRETPELEVTSAMAWGLVAATVAVSVIGGAIAMLRPVRRLLIRTSQSVEQTGQSTPSTVLTVFGSLALSGVFAGAAGIVSQMPYGVDLTPLNGSGLWPALCITVAIVLVGGVSARGGRGGVVGIVCATILLTGVTAYLYSIEPPLIVMSAIPLVFLVIGLIVSRLLGGGRGEVVDAEPSEPPANRSEPAAVAPQAPWDMPSQESVPVPSGTFSDADPEVQRYWPHEDTTPEPSSPESTAAARPTAAESADGPYPWSGGTAESAPVEQERPPQPHQYRPPAE